MQPETSSPQTFDPAIAAELQSRRRIVYVCFLVALTALVLSYVAPWPEEYAGMAFKLITVVLVAWIIPVFWKWRCPRCSKYLGGALAAKFCPGCGVPFTAQ
ncbi:hypothetical protein ACLESD_00380 [Pyxidicoccus sp. 3LFB2]